MLTDPFNCICTECGCEEHADNGRKCESCADWYCDECRSEWPEADSGDKLWCAVCFKDGEEYDKEVRQSWNNR